MSMNSFPFQIPMLVPFFDCPLYPIFRVSCLVLAVNVEADKASQFAIQLIQLNKQFHCFM